MGNYREAVEYIEVSKPDIGEKKKIKLFQGGNGDFYLTVCQHNHNGGDTIRLETSELKYMRRAALTSRVAK